eukprot:CAMPEP_0169176510 /NCGR_PEP_ID=MMETSP1015-20121227/65909_1 /TAXON_ID=342587 /ORGANISM="Karlodinium micrum, Strain CCMP2283" /LENGTH=207 /DNA_ID=CAMNT_0009251023 /DNA_START=99 /DNA_END=719 /DNA_ORIENTATION=-
MTTMLAAVLFGSIASFSSAEEIERPEKLDKPEVSNRLELACHGCFPHNRDTCDKDVWTRCCGQEIRCHDDACRKEILGRLKSGAKVRVHTDFVSDDVQQAEISRGMTGRVLQVDEDGDAFIRFWRDDLDDEYIHHWVFERTGWDKLDLTGSAAPKMRAARAASCMDACRTQDASSKSSKLHGCLYGAGRLHPACKVAEEEDESIYEM